MKLLVSLLLFAAVASVAPAVAQTPSLQQHLSDCSSGDFERVIRGCTGLINSSRVDRKNKAVAYGMRASAFASRGEFENAIEDFTRSIRNDPRSLVAFYNRGNVYLANEKFDLAISDYRRAISIDPNHAQCYAQRGSAYLAKGDTERAIADFDKALEIDPSNKQAAANRALAFTRKGDVMGVIRNFGEIVRIFFRSLLGV